MQQRSPLLVLTYKISKHIRTNHAGFSATSGGVGTTSQEGGESENNPEPNDTTDPEPNNGTNEHKLNKNWIPRSRYKREQKNKQKNI